MIEPDWGRVVLLVAAEIPLGLFVYFYTTEPVPGRKHLRRFSRVWLSTPLGPAWLGQKLAMFAIIASVIAFFIFGDYPFRRLLTDFLYVILVALFWAHFILLRRTQTTGYNPRERVADIPINKPQKEQS